MKDKAMQSEHIDAATRATVATVASYTSSGGLIVFGLTMNDLAAVVGMVLAFATFGINWFYRHKEHHRGNRQDLR